MEINLTEEQTHEAFNHLIELYKQAQDIIEHCPEGATPSAMSISPVDVIVIMDFGAMWEKRVDLFSGFMEVLEQNIDILKKRVEEVGLPEKEHKPED